VFILNRDLARDYNYYDKLHKNIYHIILTTMDPDELFHQENIDENDIITGCKNVPTIWYTDVTEKRRRHFVDIFIPLKNKCIEVKSLWTFGKQKETIFLKQQAAKELGYLYEIWIYYSKGNKVDFYA